MSLSILGKPLNRSLSDSGEDSLVPLLGSCGLSFSGEWSSVCVYGKKKEVTMVSGKLSLQPLGPTPPLKYS